MRALMYNLRSIFFRSPARPVWASGFPVPQISTAVQGLSKDHHSSSRKCPFICEIANAQFSHNHLWAMRDHPHGEAIKIPELRNRTRSSDGCGNLPDRLIISRDHSIHLPRCTIVAWGRRRLPRWLMAEAPYSWLAFHMFHLASSIFLSSSRAASTSLSHREHSFFFIYDTNFPLPKWIPGRYSPILSKNWFAEHTWAIIEDSDSADICISLAQTRWSKLRSPLGIVSAIYRMGTRKGALKWHGWKCNLDLLHLGS